MKWIALIVALLITSPALAIEYGEGQKPIHSQAAPLQGPTLKPLICDPLKLLPGCSVTSEGGASIGLESIWANIQKAVLADMKYAKAMADQANTPGSKLRSSCLAAIITIKEQQETVKGPDGNPMTPPDPHVITDLEKAAEIIDGLQATSPIMVACVPAANAAQQNALNFVNAIVTGTVLKAATGGVL